MCEKFLKSEREKTNCHQPAAVHGSAGDKDLSKRVAVLPLDPGSVEKISYIARLPDEILEKILTEALLFIWIFMAKPCLPDFQRFERSHCPLL